MSFFKNESGQLHHNPRCKGLLKIFLSAFFLVLLGCPAFSATVTWVGAEQGLPENGYTVQNWSNPGVTKTYDLGGSEKYGVSGYYQIRPTPNSSPSNVSEGVSAGNNLGITAGSNATFYSAPVFLSSSNGITGGAGTFVNFGGYSLYRGPDGSTDTLYRQGGLSVSVGSGPYNTPSGSNNGYFGDAFTLTMSSNMGADFRLGVAVDSVAQSSYAPDYVSIYNPSIGTTFSSQLPRNGWPDMAFFDVNANAGESFTAAVWQLAGSQSVAPVSLITFDVSRYKFDIASGTNTNTAILGGAAASLTKSGAGTLVITNANSYEGTTLVSGGTLGVRNANALGATNGGTIISNGVLRITATNSSGIALIGENVTLAVGATNQATLISERLTNAFTATNKYQGKITLGSAEARIDSLGGSTLVLTNSGNVIESANNTTLAIGGAGSVVLNGAVSLGTGGVQKLGSGTLFVQEEGTLGGANSSLFLTSGNIDLGARSLSNSSFTITGGVLTNGTLTAATYNLNGGSVRANLGAGSVNANSGTTSVTSEGTLGASIINVAGGTLNLQAAGRLSSGAVANVSSGMLSTGGNETITRVNATGGTVDLTDDTLTVTGTGGNKSTVGSSATLTGGTLSVQGALDYQASSGTTALSVASGGTLSGSGTTSGTLSVAGNLAPGNSTGILNVGNTTFLGGGKYTWEVDTFPGGGSGGVVGTNWDFLNITGTLTISAGTTAGNQFLIDVVSLLASNDASGYDASNFNFTDNYSFAIATASGGISGFTSANQFLINTDGFKNAITAAGYSSGTWSVSVNSSNSSLMLNYTGATAIPEPSTGSLILLGLAAVLRRRKSNR